MTPIDIQVSRYKVSVVLEGQAYSLYVGEGEGGISVLQTSIF